MKLLDSIKPRKVLLMHSEDPNKSDYCLYAHLVDDDQCPYLGFEETHPTEDKKAYCYRYRELLKEERNSGILMRCEKCCGEKI